MMIRTEKRGEIIRRIAAGQSFEAIAAATGESRVAISKFSMWLLYTGKVSIVDGKPRVTDSVTTT
jgi:hypothetical protein